MKLISNFLIIILIGLPFEKAYSFNLGDLTNQVLGKKKKKKENKKVIEEKKVEVAKTNQNPPPDKQKDSCVAHRDEERGFRIECN